MRDAWLGFSDAVVTARPFDPQPRSSVASQVRTDLVARPPGRRVVQRGSRAASSPHSVRAVILDHVGVCPRSKFCFHDCDRVRIHVRVHTRVDADPVVVKEFTTRVRLSYVPPSAHCTHGPLPPLFLFRSLSMRSCASPSHPAFKLNHWRSSSRPGSIPILDGRTRLSRAPPPSAIVSSNSVPSCSPQRHTKPLSHRGPARR